MEKEEQKFNELMEGRKGWKKGKREEERKVKKREKESRDETNLSPY